MTPAEVDSAMTTTTLGKRKREERPESLDDYICPITLGLAVQPVTLPSGAGKVDLPALKQYIQMGNRRDPFTREVFPPGFDPHVDCAARNYIQRKAMKYCGTPWGDEWLAADRERKKNKKRNKKRR